MTASTSVTVVGVKDALRELGKIEPDLKKQIQKDVKTILRPVVDEAKRAMPATPLSGMARSWKRGVLFPYDQAQVQRSIGARFNTRKRGNSLAVIAVVMKSAAGTIYDMAGKRAAAPKQQSVVGSHGRRVGSVGGPTMIRNLEARFGEASRGMWPAYERNADAVNEAVEQVAYADRVIHIEDGRILDDRRVAVLALGIVLEHQDRLPVDAILRGGHGQLVPVLGSRVVDQETPSIGKHHRVDGAVGIGEAGRAEIRPLAKIPIAPRGENRLLLGAAEDLKSAVGPQEERGLDGAPLHGAVQGFPHRPRTLGRLAPLHVDPPPGVLGARTAEDRAVGKLDRLVPHGTDRPARQPTRLRPGLSTIPGHLVAAPPGRGAGAAVGGCRLWRQLLCDRRAAGRLYRAGRSGRGADQIGRAHV